MPTPRQLFFVINQHPLDGSAHALYCFRHCWWLAQSRPESQVTLLFPGHADAAECERHFGLAKLDNFSLAGLPAMRRTKGGKGLTINLIFYLAAATYLARNARDGDLLVTASFTKLFRFLTGRNGVRKRCRTIYEVHQLVSLDEGRMSDKASKEFGILARADLLLATTGSVEKELKAHLPGKPVATLGLACGFNPADQPSLRSRNAGQPFTVGYIGSLYSGQGVDWLVENWPHIAAAQPERVSLEIIGGSATEVAKLNGVVAQKNIRNVVLRGAIPAAQLGPVISGLDALVIPCLPVGRMPHVAITKAYDYLGLRRPVLAADLPSISEVMLPEASYSFPAGDVKGLSLALQALLADPVEAARRAELAGVHSEQHGWAARAKRWWQIVDSQIKAAT